jgi:hypothetical protein
MTKEFAVVSLHPNAAAGAALSANQDPQNVVLVPMFAV